MNEREIGIYNFFKDIYYYYNKKKGYIVLFKKKKKYILNKLKENN